MKFTFHKDERLNHKVIIDSLFEESKVIKAYPLRLMYKAYNFGDEKIKGQVMFIVSKRRFKNATDRNKTKRLLREAYRLKKHEIYQLNDQRYAMAISFVGKEIASFQEVQKAMDKLIVKLTAAEQKNTDN